MLEPLQELPQVDHRHPDTHLTVGHPQVRPRCPIQHNRICLCPISLTHIHLKVDTPNNNPQLTILHKDRHPLLLMGGMDNSLTQGQDHPHNSPNIILLKILVNSPNGDENKQICDGFFFSFSFLDMDWIFIYFMHQIIS